MPERPTRSTDCVQVLFCCSYTVFIRKEKKKKKEEKKREKNKKEKKEKLGKRGEKINQQHKAFLDFEKMSFVTSQIFLYKLTFFKANTDHR